METWAWAIIVGAAASLSIAGTAALMSVKNESEKPAPAVRRHRVRGRASMTQPIHEETMYDRVNGEVGIRTLVERFYYLVLSDPSLRHYFPVTEEGMSRLRRHFALAVGQVLGGPKFVEDAAAALGGAHAHLMIPSQDYWRTVSYLFQTMSGLGIPADIADHVFHTVWALEDVVVNEPDPNYEPVQPTSGIPFGR
jgi:hemoglobin